MRLGGLASGMDTDQMVKELMKAENVKVDRVEADKQILEWKKEALNSLNKDMANFILDSKKDLGYNSLGRVGELSWLKTTNTSNDNVATVSGSASVVDGTHAIDVKNLAQGVKGGGVIKPENVGKTFKELFDDSEEFKLTDGQEISLTINGKLVVVSAEQNIKDFADAINKANAGVKASYDKSTGRFFINSEKTGADEGAIKLETNDLQMADFISNKLELQLSHKNGEEYISEKVTLIAGEEPKLYAGQDAKVIYNGIEITQSTNNFQLNGMKVDIKAKGEVNINVSTNPEAIVDKVKDFVENYNKLIEQANNLVKEKQNRNYRPLTAEQRDAMSEKEVELWDKKAKSGVARGDMDIEKMLSALRSDLYKNLEGATGKFINISQIGITTQGYEAGSAGGKLQIDEDKLRKAIGEDADSVLEVLFKEKGSAKPEGETKANSTDALAGTSDKGLFSRIFDNITDGMKSLIEKSGPGEDSALFRKVKSTIMTDFVTKGGKYSGKGSISDIDDDMLKFTKKIDDLKAQLFRKENMYYARFTAMEKAMQRANSQGDWLMQQMM